MSGDDTRRPASGNAPAPASPVTGSPPATEAMPGGPLPAVVWPGTEPVAPRAEAWATARTPPSTRMESIAFARAIDLRWQDLEEDNGVALRLPWSTAVSVGGAGTAIDPRALLTVFDHACGGAVHEVLGPRSPTATIDLRIDFMRTPPPDTDAVIHCRALSVDAASVLVQGFSWFGDDPRPTAMCVGRFIVGSAPGRSNEKSDGFPKPVIAPADAIAAVAAERAAFGRFADTLGATIDAQGGDLPALPRLVGAPMLPALHGGAVASLLIGTADARMAATVGPRQTLNSVTIQYLRASRLVPTRAVATIDKPGSRASFVSAVATQDDGGRVVASAQLSYMEGAASA